MKNKAFTLIEIMIVVAIIATLSILAIPNILRSKLIAQESLATATLRNISNACELFATSNNTQYPPSEAALTGETLPYLNQAYCGLTLQGYTYACNFSTNAYNITASPSNPGVSGNRTFIVSTGGVFNMI